MENFWTYFEVLAPSVGVGLVFWLAIRSIFRADRKERAMEAQVREQVLSETSDPRRRRPGGELEDGAEEPSESVQPRRGALNEE